MLTNFDYWSTFLDYCSTKSRLEQKVCSLEDLTLRNGVLLEKTEESEVRPPVYIVSWQREPHSVFAFGSRTGIRVGVGVTSLFHLSDFQEVPEWQSIIAMK
jgi:hypothetical protein